MLSFKGNFEKLSWGQVRQDVAKVNPPFAEIIDELNPGDDYWMVKATYPYGSLVMQRAKLMLPNAKGCIVPITDSSLAAEIREGLSYNLNSNPVSIVLNNTFEMFLPLEDRILPFNGILKPGSVFGAWRILNPGKAEQPAFIWDMTAGARSIFMLPKITEAKKHMRLKKTYDLNIGVPNTLVQHWEIFRQIANHPRFKNPWNAEILYFSEQWVNHLSDPSWQQFYQYFYTSSWAGSEFWRNNLFWNIVLSVILKGYEARPSAYIMDTAKYLLYVGVGGQPGMAPVRDTLGGPFDLIQKIYAEEYEIRNYPPIIMQPAIFNMHDPTAHSVYYSLQFPTALEFKPSSRKRISVISDLHEIRSLLIRYEQEFLSDKFNLGGTSFYELFNLIEYDYFHHGVELHSGMRNSVEMPSEDKELFTTLDGAVHKNFPDKCTFLKGCIRVAKKR